MRIGTTRDQLLLEMEAARDRVDEAIAGLSEEQIARPDLDGWSVKDHLTHLTLWHELRFFEISRIARGGRAGFPVTDEAGVEHINEQFAANRRPLPLPQVLTDLDFAREMIRQAVANCPEDRLDQRFFEELGPNGAGHETSHADMIAAWRKREGI
ncbi:MAG: maleylpyruvate isomerase family protein [Chloroflexi bacterium]|nr:MAG: maleylpyruvate isomerase family protein [Chloroflexota bacterium]TMG08920.1 MAG: maleylpyruvate isomerase family protein [Chloroflexota bacterium]